MFRSALVRLTVLYLGLTMLVSLCFSGVLYQTLNAELQGSLFRQEQVLHRFPGGIAGMPGGEAVEQGLQDEADQGSSRIIWRLVELNLIILGLAGIASYLLARFTLEPLEEAMEAQMRFAADASHELRTPLTAMRTEMEVLLRDKKADASALREQLTSSLEEIGRMEELSSGLLALARQNGSTKLELVPCELSEVARRAANTVRPLAEAKQAQIAESLEEVGAMGDPEGMVRVAVILLDNAVKYGPAEGYVRIATSKQGRHAVLEVSDEGPGIAAADLPHVFDRFWRADRSRSRHGAVGGHGLGLAIAKQLVEAQGGDIALESNGGKGTVARVRLPLAPSKE
jgi:two-component system sensor histidine kinase CiaH